MHEAEKHGKVRDASMKAVVARRRAAQKAASASANLAEAGKSLF